MFDEPWVQFVVAVVVYLGVGGGTGAFFVDSMSTKKTATKDEKEAQDSSITCVFFLSIFFWPILWAGYFVYFILHWAFE